MSHKTQILEIKKKNLKGVTLLELVVVMAIVGIMVTVITVSFGSENTKKNLETNAREFSSILREAQNYSLTGRQNDSSNTTCAYSITWTIATSTYRLNAISKNGTLCNGTSASVATYALKQGVVFSNGGAATFSLPWGATASGSAVLGKAGLSHTICLNGSGKIIDQTGSGSCP